MENFNEPQRDAAAASPSVQDQQVRLRAMRRNGDVEGLIEQLSNPAEEVDHALGHTIHTTVRGTAAVQLGRLKDARAAEPIAALLADDVRGVRMDAANALGKIQDRASVPALIAVLADEDRYVRACAAWSLAKLGDARARDPLIVSLQDEYRAVRMLVAKALARIGDRAASKPIRTAVRREWRHPTIRLRLLRSLYVLRVRWIWRKATGDRS